MPMIEDALFSMGHEAVHVTNQADAQDRLRHETFDYVLLDLHIPTQPGRGGATADTGMNLLRWIRLTNPFRLPVIIMTGYTEACLSLAKELLADGADEFIPKPFQQQGRTLRVVVRKVLDQYEVLPQATAPPEPPREPAAPSDDPEPPEIEALPQRELDILQCMAADPHKTMMMTDIITAGGYSKTATREALEYLEQRELIARPPGTTRRGLGVTKAGQDFLARISEKATGRLPETA